jgi:hypothetical protein
MVNTDFWDTVDRITADSEDTMASALLAELSRLPIPRIARFHASLMSFANQALSWELWKAADVIHRAPTSQDTFCYFRLWLVSQGPEVFTAAVANPDSLATHPWIARLSTQQRWADPDYPWAESLMYVPEQAYEQVLAKLGPAVAAQVEPPAEFDQRPAEVPDASRQWRWDDEPEIRRRFPNLCAMFTG